MSDTLPKETPAKHPFSIKTLLQNIIIPYHFHDKSVNEVTRNYLLVAATLIAAVTFQAGVNPPGGVWQDTVTCKHGDAAVTLTTSHQPVASPASPPTSSEPCEKHLAGRAIYSSETVPFATFLTFNTLALGTAIQLILSVTYEHPYFFEVLVATFSMAGTYVASITAITADDNNGFFHYGYRTFRFICFALAVPIIIRSSIFLLLKRWGNPTIENKQPDQENQSRIKDVNQRSPLIECGVCGVQIFKH